MTPPLTHARYDTPFGQLHVFADERGVVRASGFRPAVEIASQLPDALRAAGWEDGKLKAVEAAVKAWLGGDARAITQVPVEQEGGPFFQQVWEAARSVPPGEPMTYQEVAQAAGSPNASRAVGTACARNAVAPFVPCHRVVSAGGKLGSYGFGGAPIKAAMLAMEAGADAAGIAKAATEARPDSMAPATVWRPAPQPKPKYGVRR